MSQRRTATALAVVLLTATLAAPAGAIAAHPTEGVTPVATEARGGGWFASLLDSAWDWLVALVDEDNGSIIP